MTDVSRIHVEWTVIASLVLAATLAPAAGGSIPGPPHPGIQSTITAASSPSSYEYEILMHQSGLSAVAQ